MRRAAFVVILLAVLAVGGVAALQAQPQAAAPISWANFKAAQDGARSAENGGKFKEAYDFYLEYIRQAEGLQKPDIAAWGKNNAAYMLIKAHKQDRATDLAPAKKLLDEVLASADASADCKKAAETNMAYVAAAGK